MRILCPFCGERASSEFAYLGDASAARADPQGTEAMARFLEAVYFRENPAGVHTELWYHESGCRSWLRVKRDTCSHQIFDVAYAKEALRT